MRCTWAFLFRKFFLLPFVVLPFLLHAQVPGRYQKTDHGIVVWTDAAVSGRSVPVVLEVISDKIIRVVVNPGKGRRESLVTNFTYNPAQNWTVRTMGAQVHLKTKELTAVVQLNNGVVSFFDASGKKLLSEKGLHTLKPAVFEGRPSYSISQAFQTDDTDAYYGLGQHQDDVFNYKGEQVHLFQNNTEVAVPFLVSVKNYGILWDNYSLTTVGDTRPFRPLSSFRLFSKDGEEGWLSARYSNDRQQPALVQIERAEAEISMEFINESKQKLPPAFIPEQGIVLWQGKIASSFDGVHKIRMTYGGYIKLWLDGKLLLDRWRRAWNPAPALLDVTMQKDKKYDFRMEWIPDGSESYISFKWQEPHEIEEKNIFGFTSEAAQQLDYYFITGSTIDDVISGYRQLTGKAPIVPRWALGFWQSRERYKTQDELISVVAEFRKRKIPLDNIVLDWFYWKEAEWGSQEFDPARFPDPEAMIRLLHDSLHTQLMISVWPKFYEGTQNYRDFNSKGWLYKRNIADQQKDWVGPGYTSTFYDAFSEPARKAFWNLIYKKIYLKGIDAWWMDASEPDILSNVSPEKRKQQMTPVASGPVAEYLNAYPLQNAKGIYEGQRSVDPDKRVFLLTRSGFAGSQRYGAAIWSGDIGARWHDMKAQIPAGLNFSMSGLPYWTMDIGGFVVENRFERPNGADLEEWRELNTRWYQFGAFVPLFRVHGQFPFREVYNIAPDDHPAYRSMLYYNRLRYHLLPYIYSLSGAVYHRDYTMMRGLVMDFPKDTTVYSIGDQYLFGPALLVNPVYEFKATHRRIYLPATGWYHLYSGEYIKGGQWIEAAAPYERTPVYVREGSILPFGPELQYVHEKKPDSIIVHVYEGRDGSFTLYEDEGLNYQYEKGIFSTIEFKYSEKDHTLTIKKREGQYPGMLLKRVFVIRFIKKNQPSELDFDVSKGIAVQYDGAPKTLKLK